MIITADKEFNIVDHIIPMGLNCTLASLITKTLGYVESNLFTWSYIGNFSQYTDIIINADHLFDHGFSYNPAKNMIISRRYYFEMHCRSTKLQLINQKILDDKFCIINYEGIFDEIRECLQRYKYLSTKFLNYINSPNKTILILLLLHPDILRNSKLSIEECKKNIYRIYDIFNNYSCRTYLQIYCDDYLYLNKSSDFCDYLYKLDKFPPTGDAMNLNLSDVYNFSSSIKKYNIIVSEDVKNKFDEKSKNFKYNQSHL